MAGLAAITDQLLLTVAELLQSEWQELGTALRIPPGDLHPILTSVRGRPEEWPYEMLTLWYSSLPLAAKRHWLQTLVQGLAKVGRNDLVRLAKMSEQGSDSRDDPSTLAHRVFAILARHLARDWYSLGMMLNVSSDRLDSIRVGRQPLPTVDPRFQMLATWRRTYQQERDAVDVLKEALRSVYRNDLARRVTTIVAEGQSPPSTCDPSSARSHPTGTAAQAGEAGSVGRQAGQTISSFTGPWRDSRRPRPQASHASQPSSFLSRSQSQSIDKITSAYCNLNLNSAGKPADTH